MAAVNRAAHLPAAQRRGGILVAVLAGVGVGVLGTALHAHVLHAGALAFPLGAFGALLLLAAASLLAGLWGGNGWLAVLTGGVAYACVGVLSIPRGGYGLVSMNIQGMVWLYGIVVVAPLTALACFALLRRSHLPR